MDSLKRYFRLSNSGTLVFFLLNLTLLLLMFTDGFTNTEVIPVIVILYVLTIGISLSPIGEWVLSLMVGAKEIKRVDVKIRIIPLLEVVYNKAKKESPDMVNSIHIKIIHDQVPNAYALGRHTICVTDGLFKLSDEMIMGILAHEIGHIVNHHSVLQLLIGGSNLIITGFLFMLKMISYIITAVFSLFAIRTRSFLVGAFIAITGAMSTVSIWLWTKFCMLFLMASMRANEYVADEYARKIGFGYELASALDTIHMDTPSNGLLKALYSTHPDYNDRIARLQETGVAYYRY